jgi:ABC-2 type transport system permease protein
MRAFGKLALVQTKLYLREPMSVFFTLCFGPIMLVIMGFIFGSLPRTELGGMSQMEMSTTAYIGLILGLTGLTSVPIVTATRREMGVLRRLAATPLRPLVYFLTDILAPFAVTLLGILILILMGIFIYGVHFEGNWFSLFGAVCLSALSFFALGYAIAGLVRSARTAIVLGNVIIIPMVIFSGAMVPLDVMPQAVVNFSRFIPLKHVVTLVRGLWFGDLWGAHLLEVAVLAGMLAVSMLVVALTFKWE